MKTMQHSRDEVISMYSKGYRFLANFVDNCEDIYIKDFTVDLPSKVELYFKLTPEGQLLVMPNQKRMLKVDKFTSTHKLAHHYQCNDLYVSLGNQALYNLTRLHAQFTELGKLGYDCDCSKLLDMAEIRSGGGYNDSVYLVFNDFLEYEDEE